MLTRQTGSLALTRNTHTHQWRLNQQNCSCACLPKLGRHYVSSSASQRDPPQQLPDAAETGFQRDLQTHSRRQLLQAVALITGLTVLPPASKAVTIDTTITSQVYFDIGVCSSALKPQEERTLGSKSVIPDDAQPVGRITIGLYGNLAPSTVANFTTVVQAGLLNGTVFSRILPGEYIQAGKQGAKRMGELQLGPDVTLQPNTDLSSAAAFQLPHFSPGTVALSLSENDEEEPVKERPGYRPLEFLITTGPGPVPRLDGQNIVFGRVVGGLDVVRGVATVPTFQPSERANAMNRLAAFIGDDRANIVRRKYGKPLKAVVILGSGVLPAGGGQEGLVQDG